MILEKLTIENFRQFRDKQEIHFSTVPDRNVTLVHAENGFGKTALLNALLWGFYGHEGLTEDLPQKEKLIHEGVAARSRNPVKTAARATIQFRHDDDRYTLFREITLEQQQDDARKSELTLEVNQDGMPIPLKHPQAKIQAMMPSGISEFLFFNGEGIEHLAREENSPKVTEAIHQMLGLKLLQTAIDDLRHANVLGKLRAELRERTNEEKAGKIDEQEKLDEEINELNKKRDTLAKNVSATESDLALVNSRLEQNREAHQLQAQRTRLEKQRESVRERLGTINKRLGQIVAEDSYVLFAEDLVKRGREVVSKLRSENKIPARVLNSFVQELLETGKCICQRHLVEGTPERQAVEALMTVAGDQQFNTAVGALDNALGRIEEGIEHTRTALKEANAERLRLDAEIKEINEELQAIHDKLGGKENEEVQKLEESRERMLLKQRELLSEQGRNEQKLEESLKKREELRREIQEIMDNEADAQKAQRRLDAVEESVQVLGRILRLETEELRPVLNEEIDHHFQAIMAKSYWAELTPEFHLSIKKHLKAEGLEDTGGDPLAIDVALSQGERQITSLVFIASLVALARRRSEVPTIIRGLSGSEYPMVMDSPFGQLGEQYRAGIAKWIPSLAPQVVVLVSSTQFNGPVEEELKRSKRVGKRYYLAYHGPDLPKSAETELKLGNSNVTVYFEEREEFTKICELEN